MGVSTAHLYRSSGATYRPSAEAHPFYRELAAQGGGPPEWNFYKYLIDRQGRVVARFPSQTRPNDPQLIEAIEKLL